MLSEPSINCSKIIIIIIIWQVIMPGYCVQGTVGYKILNGAKKIDFEDKKVIDVNLSVEVSLWIKLLSQINYIYISFYKYVSYFNIWWFLVNIWN